MTDEPYGSLRPLTDSMVGGFLSILLITAPLGVVATDFNYVPNLQQGGLHLLREASGPDGPTQYPIQQTDTGGGLHDR